MKNLLESREFEHSHFQVYTQLFNSYDKLLKEYKADPSK